MTNSIKLNDTYLPISTAEMLTTIEDKFQEKGLQFTKITTGGDSNHWVKYTLPDISFVDSSGSQCSARLLLKNSTNRTSAFIIALGFIRYACRNGIVLTIGEAVNQRLIHRKGPKALGVLERLPTMIDVQLDYLINDELAIETARLSSKRATVEQGIEIIGNLPISDKVKHHAINNWITPVRVEDTPCNIYTLINVVNENMRHIQGGTMVYENTNHKLAEHTEFLYDNLKVAPYLVG